MGGPRTHFNTDGLPAGHNAVPAVPSRGELRLGSTHGVSEGTRTPDTLDHNQVLYQLSYTHHG
jgi:hypothetical protein